MPPRKSPTAAPTPTHDDKVDRLADAVEQLSQEVRALTSAIDDIRQEMEFTMKQLRSHVLSATHPTPQPIPLPTVPGASTITSTVMPRPVLPTATADMPQQRDLFSK